MQPSKALSRERGKQFLLDYATVFPNWGRYEDEFSLGLWRSFGPLRQNIWFGATSIGTYRLSHDVTVFVPPLSTVNDQYPWVGMLPQLMGHQVGSRLQDLRASEHATRWREAVSAIEQQFSPDIRKPLDLPEIISLCETEERPWSQNDLVMMAVLYAWQGEGDKAMQRCIRLQSVPVPHEVPEMVEWHHEMLAFGMGLLKAIEAGTEREFLEPVAKGAASLIGR